MNHHDTMSSGLRQLLQAYMSRRSPWGPPWWIYAVAFGAANLVRQVVIVVIPPDIPQSIRVASWIATAVAVVAVINSVAVAQQRRGHAARRAPAPALAPIWPLRRTDDPRPGPEQTAHSAIAGGITMANQHVHEQPTTSTTWAPWWVYLVVVVGANYLRRALVPDGSTPALRVVVALVFSAAVFVAVTVIYRAAVRPGHGGAP